MMGSPKFVMQMPLIIGGICIIGTFLATEYGREVYVKRTSIKDQNPGKDGFGYSTKKGDAAVYFDKLDRLRKVNVQTIWDEKKAPVKD